MARSKYDWTERRIKRFFREGRGTGRGQDYKPWLTTSDVPSLGRTHRIFLTKTSREHHLLSDLEYYAFLKSSFDDDVVDIREQFPLDRTETLAIAAARGIKHPQVKGVSIVMTTDFLETRVATEGHSEMAIAIKPNEELSKTRTIEKLEIERIYWSRRNIPWFIQSESSLRTTRSLNLEWIFDNTVVGDIDPVDEAGVLQNLPHGLALYQNYPLRDMCTSLDEKLEFDVGKSLQII
ncbi:MAG: Tn7 transposase TnsA N-terminal domain-containing protein, partial [Afipia sp.]|nr:Tn7 transposase TnsA N-terminal domain-containing protein [Afipia sp.]